MNNKFTPYQIFTLQHISSGNEVQLWKSKGLHLKKKSNLKEIKLQVKTETADLHVTLHLFIYI